MTVQFVLLFLYLNILSFILRFSQPVFKLSFAPPWNEYFFLQPSLSLQTLFADVRCRKNELGTCYSLLLFRTVLYALLAYSQHINDKNATNGNSDAQEQGKQYQEKLVIHLRCESCTNYKGMIIMDQVNYTKM